MSIDTNNIMTLKDGTTIDLNGVRIDFDEKGHILLFDSNGKQILDKKIVEEISKNPHFIEQRNWMLKLDDKISLKDISTFNSYMKSIKNIYKQSPSKIKSHSDFEKELEDLSDRYTAKEFEEPIPNVDSIKKELEEDSKNIKSLLFWKVKSKRKDYVENNYMNVYNSRLEEWKERKRIFEQEEKDKVDIEKQRLKELINGNEKYVKTEFDKWIDSNFNKLILPEKVGLSYNYDSKNNKMIIKIDLPEYENFPQQFATQYANGRIDYKYKRQNEIHYDYRKCVFGLAVFVAGNIFNMIPKIDEMIVSGYSQRNDGNGKIIDDYLYSIVFDRESLSMHKLNEEDPFKLCMSFKNRCECNDINRLLSIDPFE